jgi:hypothetical protein
MAVAYWVESMARDETQAKSQHNSQLLDIELREFAGHVLGASKQKRGWVMTR